VCTRKRKKRQIGPLEAVQKARHKLDLARFHCRALRNASTKNAVRDPLAIEAYLTAALGAGVSVFYTLHEGFGPRFEDAKRRLREAIGDVNDRFFYRMIGYRGMDVHLSFLDASYETEWKPPHEVQGVSDWSSPAVLTGNPAPVRVGLSVPILDEVPAYDACERFLEMLQRLIQLCEAGGTAPCPPPSPPAA